MDKTETVHQEGHQGWCCSADDLFSEEELMG